MHILLTGFGPFADFEENPSEVYAKEVQLEGCFITRKVVPVSDEGVIALIRELACDCPYDAVILMGVNARDSRFRLELLATNAFPNSPAKPTHRLLTTCSMADLRWAPYHRDYSFDAGSYYCNQLYYEVLNVVYMRNLSKNGNYIPVMFVHVPPFEEIEITQGISILQEILLTILATSYKS